MARTRSFIPSKTWADYDIGNPSGASLQEIQKAVRRAAKAANQRLLRLERAGKTRGAYSVAMAGLQGRKRFWENTSKKSVNELRGEYVRLRAFIASRVSTVQGIRESEDKRFDTAKKNGYTGTQEQFEFDIARAFTSEIEKYFASNVIYKATTSGTVDVLAKIIEDEKKREEKKQGREGRMLLEYLRKTRKGS